MRNTLFIRVLEPDCSRATWAVLDDSGKPAAGPSRGTLAQAAAAADGRRVVVALPGTDVLLSRAAIPTRNRQRLLQAVPFALEDQLAADVESLHFAAGGRDSDGQVAVAVVDRTWMQTCVAALSEAGLAPDTVTADTLTLPWQPDEWTVLLETDRATVRTGAQAGFAAEPELLPALVAAAREQEGALPSRVRILNADGANTLAASLTELLEGLECRIEDVAGDAVELMAGTGDEQTLLDLLQGAFAKPGTLAQTWRRWRPAAAAAAALILLQIGLTAVQYHHLTTQVTQLDAQIDTLYRKTFPESHRIVNARAQMEQKLHALRGSAGDTRSGLLPLLTQAGPTLSSVPGLNINALDYRGNNLDLELTVTDIQSLDQMKQKLERAGLQVDIRSATARDQGVSSRVRIAGGAS
jgi:general secretion pathway protein L